MADQLNRSLNLTQLVFYGVGTIVGAGIYSVIGAAAGEAGHFLWVSFLFAALVAFLTALSYAELSSLYSRAGAEYQYLKNAFPQWPLISFMGGYLIALNSSATMATVSLAFAGYLGLFLPVPQLAIAYGLLMLCTAINIAGIRQATWVSISLICVEVTGLLVVIFAGFSEGELDRNRLQGLEGLQISSLLSATALIFFIYIGFEDVANLSEEAKKPQKNIPLALLASVLLTSILYILVALSVIALIDPAALAKSDSPLSEAVGTVMPQFEKAIGITALFATASTALITSVSISRLLFGMARDRIMPPALARLLPARRTPWVAALALLGAASCLLPLNVIKTVASISSFGVLLVFTSIQIAVIVLRHTRPDLERSFRVPVSIGKTPLLPVAGSIITLGLLTQFEPIVYLIGGGAILMGPIIYKYTIPRHPPENI